ncbi:class I adenylate-forming enzyme family protein [Adlercreutzia sp. ZJ141]|uniref:class I adenylate-forming enzyme family protein n=1 Tax=Adlercreutzia sp. ZJ141 TaxID=2709406 RepID=UPI0013EA32E2|nr:AMP-binding protein [Adlercreutzia sp. ZJ141]
MNDSQDSFSLIEQAVKQCNPLWTKQYDTAVDRSYEVPTTTIKQTMIDLVDRARRDPFIYFGDQVILREEADMQANRLGNALLALGLKKGDRVSLVVSNRPEIIYGFMACYKTGLVAAAYNQRCTSYEICGSINTVSSSVVIIEQEHINKILDALKTGKCPSVRSVIVLDRPSDQPESTGTAIVYCYKQLLSQASACEPSVEVLPSDNAILLFTGGTTGVSKGVCATQGEMVREIKTMHHWAAPALTKPDPSVLICMPLTHIMGINYGVHWQIICGGSCIFAEGVHCDEIIDSFEKYHPTMWATLPTLLHRVSLDERLSTCSYHDLDFVIFGGSFISLKTLSILESSTNACFTESYGMSESFGFVSANPVLTGGKLGSIGVPISGIDMLIVDPQNGLAPCAPGERGEIIFRGKQIAKSYWNNPEETAKAIRGGWMYTGDIGYMDEEGFFYIVDRKKDMIVVSGFNVFPKDIDECLMTHPAVADACTIGVPDAYSGERPKSFVVLKRGLTATEDELRTYCKKRLVAYKVPKYIEFIDVIPTTHNRKQDRVLLRKREEKESVRNLLSPLDSQSI